jgi:hypothetical protein
MGNINKYRPYNLNLDTDTIEKGRIIAEIEDRSLSSIVRAFIRERFAEYDLDDVPAQEAPAATHEALKTKPLASPPVVQEPQNNGWFSREWMRRK